MLRDPIVRERLKRQAREEGRAWRWGLLVAFALVLTERSCR